jgi:hypothetical protein
LAAFPLNDPGQYDVVDVQNLAECEASCLSDAQCTYVELVYGTECWRYNVPLDMSGGSLDFDTAMLYERGCFAKK